MNSMDCSLCENRGMRIVDDGSGRSHAEPCSCRRERRARKVMEQARIPLRYEHCTLDAYEASYNGAHRSLARAYRTAVEFVRGYPIETAGTGLLLTGSIGVGKTHLAVGILRALLTERGSQGIFYDYRDLLKRIQNSYNANVAATEMEILQPIFDAEILVLDEIGASKPSEWVWDTVAHVLNTRYNDRKTTILTTNYANLPPSMAGNVTSISQARSAMREESLGERIGERMRSRLQEMCLIVEMTGDDFREKIKRATL